MADNTIWSTLGPEYERLRTFYDSARGFGWSVLLPAEAVRGINTQFTMLGVTLSRLKAGGDLGAGVINGSITPERWATIANEVGRALQDILNQISDNNLVTRFWTEVVVKSGSDVRTGVIDVAEATPGVLNSLAWLLGLYVLLQVVRAFK